MRRTLGTLLLMLTLAGCGDDDTEPSSTALDYDVVAIVSETAAGGAVSEQLTPVSTPEELSAFLGQFDNEAFSQEIAAEVQGHEPREGYDVAAAVVSIGCDVPPGVTVEAADDAYLVQADKVAEPLPECFAPVTSVAVIEVPQS